jgi:hypothetical protein
VGTLMAFSTDASSSSTFGGTINIGGISAAGDNTFTNNGGFVSDLADGLTAFSQGSSAGTATVTNNGGTVEGAYGGETSFSGSASAGSATLTGQRWFSWWPWWDDLLPRLFHRGRIAY